MSSCVIACLLRCYSEHDAKVSFAIAGAADAEMAYLASEPDGSGTPIHIPGRLISKKHAQAEAEGVPVLEATWKKILDLAGEC